MSASKIPTEIVNYICRLAAGKKYNWYPFFCPKTGKLSWKMNIYSKKMHKYSKRFINTIKVMNITKSIVQCYYYNENVQLLLFECPIYYAIYPKYYYYKPYFVSKIYHGDNIYTMNVNVRIPPYLHIGIMQEVGLIIDNSQLYELTYDLCEVKKRYIYDKSVKCYEIIGLNIYPDRVVIGVHII